MRRASLCLLLVASLLIVSPISAAGPSCAAARRACIATAASTGRACDRDCTRLADGGEVSACRSSCRTVRRAARDRCRAVVDPCAVACPEGDPSCGAPNMDPSKLQAAHYSDCPVSAKGKP